MARKEENFNKNLASFFDEVDDLEPTPLTDILKSKNERYYNFIYYCSGGLKSIQRCTDRKTGREVAMAELKDKANPAKKEAFLREARLSAMLQHPNIVPIYDIGLKDDQPWFTMKFISGQSLGEIIDKLSKKSTQKFNDLATRLDIFSKVCDAMAYAHSRGVLHLDLKPDNIQISDYGDVVLCDWGLGQILASECDDELLECYSFNSNDLNSMTIDGVIKGTPGYMAPEQTSLIKNKKGIHTDIFSLGCILYTLLTLKKPFTGNELNTLLAKTASCDFQSPSKRCPNLHVPLPLEAVCLKAMSQDPKDRYSSVADLQKEILNYRNGFATSAENASLLKLLQLWYKRHRALSILSLLTFFISLGAVFVLMNNLKLANVNALQLAEKLRIEKDYALKINKESAPRFLERAEYAYRTFNLEDAANFSNSTVELDPSLIRGWQIKAELHFLAQEFRAALEAFQKSPGSQKLQALCRDYIKIKPDDNLPLRIDDYLALFKRCKQLALKTQISGLLHKKAYSKMSIDDREHFCQGILKIHNQLNSLHFSYNRQTRHLDVSNNPHIVTALVLQNFPCKSINISHSNISDFICFRSQPLEQLNVSHTPLVELLSLNNTNLRTLNISHTSIGNLTRLHGMPLEELNISHSNVKDLGFTNHLMQLRKLIVHRDQFSTEALSKLSKDIKIIYN